MLLNLILLKDLRKKGRKKSKISCRELKVLFYIYDLRIDRVWGKKNIYWMILLWSNDFKSIEVEIDG